MSAGDQVKRAFDDASNHVQSQITTELIGTNTALIQRVSIANGRVQQLEAENASLRQEKKALQKKLDELDGSSSAARRKLDASQASLAEWMVSQKAFKQLAIEFGLARGMTHQEVIRMGVGKKMAVLDGQFAPEYNTNAPDDAFLAARIVSLKDVLLEQTKQREAEALADQTFAEDVERLVDAGTLLRIGAEPTGWGAAFQYWLGLARQGMGEAQHNVGWCYWSGKGTAADRRRSLEWYGEALDRGVAATAWCMYQLDKWDSQRGSFETFSGAGKRCVARGVELGQEWAVAIDQDMKRHQARRAEEERICEEEQALFSKVRQYHIGRAKPTGALEEIKARASALLDLACGLYDCEVRFVTRNIYNRGNFFRRDEIADYYLYIDNPLDRPVSFNMFHARDAGMPFKESVVIPPKSSREFSIRNAPLTAPPNVEINLIEPTWSMRALAQKKMLEQSSAQG